MRFEDQSNCLAGSRSSQMMEFLPEHSNMKHLFISFLNFAPHFPAPGRKRQNTTNSSHREFPSHWFHRAVMLFCMMVLFLLSGALPGSEKAERKTVRVPVFAYERMMVLDEDRNPISGYAYEYIQTIGAYAGWDVEYIPCESFSECLNKLLAGEVDLFYELS